MPRSQGLYTNVFLKLNPVTHVTLNKNNDDDDDDNNNKKKNNNNNNALLKGNEIWAPTQRYLNTIQSE